MNNSIRIGDQLELPGPPELAAVARAVAEQQAGAFSVAADVKAAHRLVKVRPADWPELSLRIRLSGLTGLVPLVSVPPPFGGRDSSEALAGWSVPASVHLFGSSCLPTMCMEFSLAGGNSCCFGYG